MKVIDVQPTSSNEFHVVVIVCYFVSSLWAFKTWGYVFLYSTDLLSLIDIYVKHWLVFSIKKIIAT